MFSTRLVRVATTTTRGSMANLIKPTTFKPTQTTLAISQRLPATTPLMTQSHRGLATSLSAQRALARVFTKSTPLTTPTTFNTPITTPRRNMGLGSYVSEKIEHKKNEMQQHKERESYRHLRDYLISCPKFRFKEHLAYYEALQAKVGKTDRLIGGQDVKVQEEMMKKKIDMLKAMTPLEQLYESPAALNMMSKSRISVATGMDRKAIEEDLKRFDEMKTMHTWIHRRLKNGKSLPEDAVEMQKLMAEDPPPPSYNQIKMMQKAKQNARGGMGPR